MAKYGKKAQDKVEKAMHEMKRGKLRSGRGVKKVTNRKQATAIGLSEARESGAGQDAVSADRAVVSDHVHHHRLSDRDSADRGRRIRHLLMEER